MRALPEILERHADDAAFLWERRERARRSPLVDFAALADVDERLGANLEGLCEGGEAGLTLALESLSCGAAGARFAAAFVAAALGDTMTFARQLAAAAQDTASEREVVSALAWLPAATAERVIAEMLAGDAAPALHRLGLLACAARRHDPELPLARMVESPDEATRIAACRAAGELGRRDVVPALRAVLRREEGSPAADRAAWSAVLLGDRAAAPALWRVAEAGGPFSATACALASRLGDPDTGGRLRALAASPDGHPARLRAALAGAEAWGDPACLDWVLDVMASRAEVARRALWVYSSITGARLEPPLVLPGAGRGFDVPSDEQIARRAADPCEDLRAPDVRAVRAHRGREAASLSAGTRYLAGRPMGAAWLRACLAGGLQPVRASAAVELCLRDDREPPPRPGAGCLFPVGAPTDAQLAHLSAGH